jgi:hypothetical protein
MAQSTPLVFDDHISIDTSLVLEVENDILESILRGEPYCLRGQAGTSAALCTEFSTQQLRQVVNSNTCLLVGGTNRANAELAQTAISMGESVDNITSSPATDSNPATQPAYPQTTTPLNLPENNTITSIVTCSYDALPPTTVDLAFTFHEILQLFPTNKQFSLDHVKLLMVIYKQNRPLYYKIVNSYNLDGFKQGDGYEFGMGQDDMKNTTLSTQNATFTQLSGLDILDDFDHDNNDQSNATSNAKKQRVSGLYGRKNAHPENNHSAPSRFEAGIIINKQSSTNSLILTTNNPVAAKGDKAISTLFNWSSKNSIPMIYGYDFSTLSNLIQLSTLQLMHTLPQFPLIMLENRYSLLSYDVIKETISQTLDILAIFRKKYGIPMVNPALFNPPHPTTGLLSETNGVVVSRNILLHELENDGLCCPLVTLSTLLYFIDWETTESMYGNGGYGNGFINTDRNPEPQDKSPDEILKDAEIKQHSYYTYNKFFTKLGSQLETKTHKIPNTIPLHYQDFDSYSYHINDLFSFSTFPILPKPSTTSITNLPNLLLNPSSHTTPNTSLISCIPPIFVISMSKVLKFFTHDIAIKHHATHNTHQQLGSKNTSTTTHLPSIPLETLFLILRQTIPNSILPSLNTILIDLAGTIIVDDVQYTAQRGYPPCYNIGAKNLPKYPITFNLADFSPKATLHLVQSSLHHPLYNNPVNFNLLSSAKECFDYLFKIRKYWPVPALKPFLDRVVFYNDINPALIKKMYEREQNSSNLSIFSFNRPQHFFPASQLLQFVTIASIDAFLLKYARAVTSNLKDEKGNPYQINVTYCAR